jgi:hyperosmotically inducible periplasmic protein
MPPNLLYPYSLVVSGSGQRAADEGPEEEELKTFRSRENGSGRPILVLALLVLVVAAVYFISRRDSSVQNVFSSIKESTQDAATTSKVRTALLLSKHVSPYDIKVETIQGDVTLEGQVPSEQVKAVAGAIAQDTASVKQVHNNLGLNPAIERNPDREHLGERVADLEIQTLVSDALSKNSDLAEKHIATGVKNRIVALSGTVQTNNQKYAAEQITWRVPGVQGLTDNLSVLDPQAVPESADDKLVRRVEFELYSSKAIPLKTVQIHADNGVVTLTGTVLSRAEKLLAEKIAKSVEGVRKVVNNLAAPEET